MCRCWKATTMFSN